VKVSEIRELAPAERERELERSRRELLNLRCRLALGEEIKSGEMREVRRTIARILTVQREEGATAASAAAETQASGSE
jgi:large subunit ribosomal protein L29